MWQYYQEETSAMHLSAENGIISTESNSSKI